MPDLLTVPASAAEGCGHGCLIVRVPVWGTCNVFLVIGRGSGLGRGPRLQRAHVRQSASTMRRSERKPRRWVVFGDDELVFNGVEKAFGDDDDREAVYRHECDECVNDAVNRGWTEPNEAAIKQVT